MTEQAEAISASFQSFVGPARIPELQARVRPEATAMEVAGKVTTYAELEARSAALARALVGSNARPGDRVAALLPNTGETFEILFAAARARNCFVPINRRLAASEIAKLLDDAAPAFLFVDPSLRDEADAALALAATRPVMVDADEAGLRRFVEAATAAPDLPPAQPDDDLILLYTSGTTGLPKGVRHTHANYQAMLRLSEAVPGFAYAADDVVMDVMPLCHVAGLNSGLMTFSGGGRLVILREFAPAAALEAIHAERVTKTLLAPVMLRRLLEAAEIGEAP